MYHQPDVSACHQPEPMIFLEHYASRPLLKTSFMSIQTPPFSHCPTGCADKFTPGRPLHASAHTRVAGLFRNRALPATFPSLLDSKFFMFTFFFSSPLANTPQTVQSRWYIHNAYRRISEYAKAEECYELGESGAKRREEQYRKGGFLCLTFLSPLLSILNSLVIIMSDEVLRIFMRWLIFWIF